ncbi:hypothetical protein Tco_1268933 [Tanacetum coccineum]
MLRLGSHFGCDLLFLSMLSDQLEQIRILLLPVACNDVLLESETKEDNHGSESESHNDRHKVDKLLLKKNAIGLEVKDEHMADAENNFQFLNEHEIQRW